MLFNKWYVWSPGFEIRSDGVTSQTPAIYTRYKVAPNGSYCTNNVNSVYFKLQITILLTQRKNLVNVDNDKTSIYMLFKFCLQVFFSFFLSWVSNTQPNHWIKRMANI